MNSIKVSVIVPIYNVEQYLSQCLNSLKRQTLKGLEVWLVNDGTKDSSGEIAKQYAEETPELFHYLEKENGGLSDARNYALPFISGEYTAFVDSDDYIAPEMYETLWNKAKEKDYEMVDCEFEYVYDDSTKSRRVHFKDCFDISEYMLSAYPNAWNKIYKTSWLKKLNVVFPKGYWHEDIDFFFRIIPFVSKQPATVHKCLYFYRQRCGSIMSKPDKRILDLHRIYSNLFLYYKAHGLLGVYQEVLEYKYLRTNFSSFLYRMLKIDDKKFKSDVINESWRLFNDIRPNWRKNRYLKKLSLRNFFFRSLSPALLKGLQLFVR